MIVTEFLIRPYRSAVITLSSYEEDDIPLSVGEKFKVANLHVEILGRMNGKILAREISKHPMLEKIEIFQLKGITLED